MPAFPAGPKKFPIVRSFGVELATQSRRSGQTRERSNSSAKGEGGLPVIR